MAITGSGTQGDPYIVHDYSELVTGFSGSHSYVKLANDIDCNDYGESFVWNTVSIGAGDLDLNGFVIKNVSVNVNKELFLAAGGLIHDGKLLNIFGNGCQHITDNAFFRRVSASINALTCTGAVIKCAYGSNDILLDKCSFYIKDPKYGIFHSETGGGGFTLRESDILIDSSVANTGSESTGYWKTLITGNMDRCRLRGSMPSFTGTALMQRDIIDCVIDLNCSTMSLQQGKITSNGATVSTSAINTEILPQDSSIYNTGFIKCSTAEIRNGNSLRGKGFQVVNVSD